MLPQRCNRPERVGPNGRQAYAPAVQRSCDALLLDLDGTLLDRSEGVRPASLAALRRAQEAGVRVLVATGRSWLSAEPILVELDLGTPAVLFNGAAVLDLEEGRLVEERLLANRTMERLHAFRREHDDLMILMGARRKLCLTPRSEAEERSLDGLIGVEYATEEELVAEECVIRATFLAERDEDPLAYAEAIARRVDRPIYTTHFPLSILARHRESRFVAVDVHAPCLGKAEALRVVEERYGIAPERVCAVGDADNDLPMLRAAGLGVAMGNALPEIQAEADLVIGANDTDAIAALVEGLLAGEVAPAAGS